MFDDILLIVSIVLCVGIIWAAIIAEVKARTFVRLYFQDNEKIDFDKVKLVKFDKDKDESDEDSKEK